MLACIGSSYGESDELGKAVLDALDGTDGTWGDTTVQGCFLQDDGITDDVMTEPETEEVLYYVQEITFLVWYIG